KIWASLLKDTLKRRRPDFSETYYGFRTFGNLLEEAQTRGLFEFGRDEKSGTYVFRSANAPIAMPAPELVVVPDTGAAESEEGADEAEVVEARPDSRRRGRGGRNKGAGRGEAAAALSFDAVPDALPDAVEPEPAMPETDQPVPVDNQPDTRRRNRGGRNKGAGRGDPAAGAPEAAAPGLAQLDELAPAAPLAEEAAPQAIEAPADSVAADVPAPAKERRRAPRKPAARKAAATDGTAAAESLLTPSEPAPDAPAAGAGALASAGGDADLDHDDDTSNDVDGNVAEVKVARKKPGGPARKPAARSTAPRGRRPAKPKTPSKG
ncbi:MAG: NYN domain protein, partial [Candidatus Accumulibacter sp.]|nr:NYN domain protein [Accumulibacter sp.]